jgi:anti-sigma factor RsiW
MCDKELLVGHLYGELKPAEQRALEQHLAACAECREELESFRATRACLTSWAPPQPDLGFQIVRSQPAPAPRRWRVSPAWGLAAAAVLVMAAAAAIANVEIRNTNEGLLIRTGWHSTTADRGAQLAANAVTVSAADLERVAQRLNSVEAQLAARETAVVGTETREGRSSDAELRRLVRQWIHESELRQQGVLARQIVQVARDVENGRRTDFERIRQSMVQIQGRADETFFRQRAMEDQLLRVGLQR